MIGLLFEQMIGAIIIMVRLAVVAIVFMTKAMATETVSVVTPSARRCSAIANALTLAEHGT